MLFNSYEFVFIFLPVAVTGFWLLLRIAGHSGAVMWLLLASIVFYAHASPASLAIIVPSILIDYGIASLLLRANSSRARLRNALSFVGIALNVLFLGYFKYRNFFLDTANTVFDTHFELKQLILPIGLSFLVFQKIAFLLDIHSGKLETIRFSDYLLFMLFYPRAVAGPITHYNEVAPQFANDSAPKLSTDLAVGICLFSIGLFKKSVIADGVGLYVPDLFDSDLTTPGSQQSPALLASWVGVISFNFQLYFDFSGYSDMALGVARMVGVRLPMNFNSPFRAGSIVEFWSRWHMTLTRFLTEYVYTPMVLRLTRRRMAQGKPVLCGKRSTVTAIGTLIFFPTLATMAISGLWHGAGWTFVLYGLLHGVYLSINQSWRILRQRFWPDRVSYERIMRPLGVLVTFNAVAVSQVLFRSNSVTSALSIMQGLIGLNGTAPPDIRLLRTVGISLPEAFTMQLLPVTAVPWLTLLYLTVMLLPNCQELLRRFQPALDFPASESETPVIQSRPSMSSSNGLTSRSNSIPKRLCLRFVALGEISKTGASLGPAFAALVALLGVLGLMAVGHGRSFVYGRF